MKNLFTILICLFIYIAFGQTAEFYFNPLVQGNAVNHEDNDRSYRTSKNQQSTNIEVITLYDKDDKARAFIDLADLTIYLWDGKPIAYLHIENTYNNNNDFDIYGFNGKHLGWFVDGVVRDHKGNAVGSISDAIEGYKAIKQIKPIKGIKQIAPLKPIWINYWSKESLTLFLSKGKPNYY